MVTGTLFALDYTCDRAGRGISPLVCGQRPDISLLPAPHYLKNKYECIKVRQAATRGRSDLNFTNLSS